MAIQAPVSPTLRTCRPRSPTDALAGAAARRHERVLVQGLGAPLLPAGTAGRGSAPPLRRAAARGRAEQHLLRVADAGQDRGLARCDTRPLPVLGQGAA